MPLSSDASEAVSQVLVLTADITERKRAEQQERALQIANEKNTIFSAPSRTISRLPSPS
jgi:hypothetical protein